MKRLTENAILREKNEVKFITFDALDNIDFIVNGFSTKKGGVSEGVYAEMNLGFDRGDKKENVLENFKRIGDAIGFDYRDVVMTDQFHTVNIRVVTEADKGKGVIRDKDYDNIDGHITNIPGIPLLVYGADCPPVYLVNTEKRAIGLCHSGWKGTLNEIAAETIKAMKREYEANPEYTVAVIGPSICGDCYEVGEDVAKPFISRFSVYGQMAKEILRPGQSAGKYYLNLKQAIKMTLLSSGIPAENIHFSDVCTMCNSEILFSHRRDKEARGSMAAFLMLK